MAAVMSELVPVAELNLDMGLYPRNSVSEAHVTELARVMEGGHELPAIVACRATKRIADGAHRWTAAVRRGSETIAVDWRDYADDKAFFRDAVLLNSGQGLNFTSYDRLKVITVGREFGLKEIDLAGLLRTSPSYIKALMPRYAVMTEDQKRGKAERTSRVPLKASTRHLSGQTITPKQADAIRGNAPGTSYLLTVRQLASALENDLLPPPGQHPALWQELEQLGEMIAAAAAATAA
jgi:hypothetical protein